jgi:hypothetical protein
MKKKSRFVRRKIRPKNNVLSLQLGRARARQSRGNSNQHVSLVVSNSETKEFGNQRLLEGRMHCFEAVWSIYCSSFKRSAMLPNSSCRPLGEPLADCVQTVRAVVG